MVVVVVTRMGDVRGLSAVGGDASEDEMEETEESEAADKEFELRRRNVEVEEVDLEDTVEVVDVVDVVEEVEEVEVRRSWLGRLFSLLQRRTGPRWLQDKR